MQRLPNVHPSNTVLYPTGIGSFKIGAANEGSKILLYNGTQLTLQLDFLNGKSDTLHPWEANYWVVDGDTKEIQWAIDTDSLNVSTPPISAVFLTLYGANETVSGTYPVSLFYQTSLGGGTTSTNVGTVSSISNDGNPSGTTLIESTVLGQVGHVMLTNDGILNLFTLISGVMVELIQTQATGNPLLLGTLSKITEILGSLTVDQNVIITGTETVTGNTSLSTLSSSGLATLNSIQTNTVQDSNGNSYIAITPSSVTRVNTNAGGTVALQVSGVSQATFSSATCNVTPPIVCSSSITSNGGFTLGGSTFNYALYTNSLSRISTGTYAGSTVSHTVNHNLGAIPSNVLTSGGVSTGTSTGGSDTYTSTTFTALEAFATTMRFRAERF
jgi:hypothetical protein